jgi:hypothetical protein
MVAMTTEILGYLCRSFESMIPKVDTGFRKRSCSLNKLKRDDNEKSSRSETRRPRYSSGTWSLTLMPSFFSKASTLARPGSLLGSQPSTFFHLPSWMVTVRVT